MIALAVGLFGLGRPFHIDDPAYLADFARAFSFPGGQHVYIPGRLGLSVVHGEARRALGPEDGRPEAGDLIVRPRVAANHDLSEALKQRAVRVESREAKDALPLRSMAREAGAGFYSHGWGYLPFGWSREPLESFEVYKVTTASASDGARAAER